MKKIVFLIMTAIFACLNMVMADTVCSIQGDVIVSSSKYIDPFWSDSIPHSSINYVKKSKITLDASDGYYDINFYRPANGEEIEEDLATFGDVFFSKMVIDYHAHDLTKTTQTTTLYNDAYWFNIDHWTYNTYTDNPWKVNSDAACRVIKLSSDSFALLLRGQRDSIDPPTVSIFVLHKGQVKLVYNKHMEINDIKQNNSSTVYELQNNKYDDADKIIPDYYDLVFEKEQISIVKKTSSTRK